VVSDRKFGERFPPKTIAIVGVSSKGGTSAPVGGTGPPGYTGLMLFRMLRESGFEGRVYPVNPKANEIDGVKAYPSVSDVPEPLDLVTITVPAAVVPQVLEDCVAAGALNVQITTAGFSETGEAEAKELDERIRGIASRGGLRVIGPNCMGFHIPSVRMTMFEDVALVEGPVAFVSQSGGHSRILLKHAPDFGFGTSKVISYGNALILDAPDFLEYLADDPETQIICMYLEGVKDGRRFAELVRRTNCVKPVIIWKGGLTESGGWAAVSHTASLAGNRLIWEAFFKQTGAVSVGSIEEMAEVVMTMLHLKPSPSRRVAVLSAGGGNNVATGDICAEECLEVPALSHRTMAKLREFVSSVNQGLMNPMDAPGVLAQDTLLKQVLQLLATDPMIDAIIVHLGAEFFLGPLGGARAEFEKAILESDQKNPGGVNVVVAVSDEYRDDNTEKFARELRQSGITAYGSLRRACRALRRFATYNEFVSRMGAQPKAEEQCYTRGKAPGSASGPAVARR